MSWERLEQIVSVDSPWVRLVAERWRDEAGRLLDYWRAERAHSVIVAAVQGGRLLVPRPMFRPGVGRPTLDLAGGRLPAGQTPLEAAPAILRRELGIPAEAVRALRPVNEVGWIVNSSFESQLLFGVLAEIDEAATPAPELLERAVPYDMVGVAALARELECLQCRAVLQELLLTMGEG
ncbi:MAG: NUDIX hydrolase [Chloroflexales bacterium]|nr:NUDIX hydrolase [Chloroflexales bacterium]